MVNLTALVKATITLPLAVSSAAATFTLIFAQQFLLNLNRFPLFCGNSKTPAPPPPPRCSRRRRKGGYPRRGALGVRGTNPPARDPAFSRAGGGPGAKGGMLGACFLPGGDRGLREAVGDAPGIWRSWGIRGAVVSSPSSMGRVERNLGKTRRTSLLIAGTLQKPKFT